MRGSLRLRSAAMAAIVALASPPGTRADDLLVIDRDAHAVSADSGGAVFAVDPAAGALSPPAVVAAADAGAPFESLQGGTVAPADGATFICDEGRISAPVLHRVDCVTGDVTPAASHPAFRAPFGASMLADGRLVMVDPEADPAGLGPDDVGGTGHGAVFVVDVRSCTTGCAVRVLSDGTQHPFGASVRSAFQEPLAIQYDPVRTRVLIAERFDMVGATSGAVYSVSVATGEVGLVAKNSAWGMLIGLGIEADGTILVVDYGNGPGDATVWRVDPANPDPAMNATLLSGGPQYAVLEDVEVDAGGRMFLADSGEWDSASGTFLVLPAVFEVDLTDPNPLTNGRLVNQGADLAYPIGLATRPACATPPRLAVNRRARRDIAWVRLQFVDVTCLTPPWSFCVEQFVDASLDGLVMPGDAAPTAPDTVWFYEHSDAVGTMTLRRAGADLVFARN